MLESIIGLFIGILYLIFDTQLIIRKTESGTFEVYKDAKHLLIDLFKIFIEIAKILLKKEEEREKKKK